MTAMRRYYDAKTSHGWRHRCYTIIFGTDTLAGRLFDLLLIACILVSVGVVMFDSMSAVHRRYSELLMQLEWGFTLLFTVEYLLRLVVLRHPMKYALSVFGLIDLLAILPTWLSLFLPGGHYLIIIRVLRVLRIFRVLKLVEYIGQSRLILRALAASRTKILVFLFAVLSIVTVFGSLMYLIEGPENGFRSIPHSIYWAIVTLTTVGYGDVSPKTPLGQLLSSLIMLVGYAIIAVPTGIVTASMVEQGRACRASACPQCGGRGHELDARHCKHCGAVLCPKQDGAGGGPERGENEAVDQGRQAGR